MIKRTNQVDIRKEREKHGKQIPVITLNSRINRRKEMMQRGRTLQELVTIPANTRIIINKSSKKGRSEGSQHPELYKRRKEGHHETVSRKTAQIRVNTYGRGIEAAMRVSKKRGS